jgi:hypothetical protein
MATQKATAPVTLEFDMSDPDSASYGEGARFLRQMIDPSAFITNETARVLHLADRTAAGLPTGGRTFLARSRELFARAMATIDSHDMPVEVRHAVDTAIREASKITEIKGGFDTVQFERRFGRLERTRPMQAGRKKSGPRSSRFKRRELWRSAEKMAGRSLNATGRGPSARSL